MKCVQILLGVVFAHTFKLKVGASWLFVVFVVGDQGSLVSLSTYIRSRPNPLDERLVNVETHDDNG